MTINILAKHVAIIGAGVSGVAAASHLLAAGLDVTVFERNHAAGGVWLHDPRRPIEPPYPSTKASKAEQSGDDSRTEQRPALQHAPPGPCYDGLKNNVATRLMRTKLNAWPEGTPDFVSHEVLRDYIQDTSRKCGADKVTIYGARVLDVRKVESLWKITWSTLKQDPQAQLWQEERYDSMCDAVVVASGHYHAPKIPDIPGLADSKSRWPARIWHSKAYRDPAEFENKNVLLLGAGVSSTDIARELGPVAREIYQSSRNGLFDLPATVLPENGIRVSEITSFELTDEGGSRSFADDDPLPVIVHLKSGQKLCEIHAVILCTGYHITFPFLSDYHNDETSPAEASDTVLVTDGAQVHNLHKDIFYIPDPTLAFVGVPFYTATFTLFEFQAIVVTAVFAGNASLPEQSKQREEYEAKVAQKGVGRVFHSLHNQEEEYVKDLLEWINRDGAARGLTTVQGHTATWLEAKEEQRERMKALFGAPGEKKDSSDVTVAPLLRVCA